MAFSKFEISTHPRHCVTHPAQSWAGRRKSFTEILPRTRQNLCETKIPLPSMLGKGTKGDGVVYYVHIVFDFEKAMTITAALPVKNTEKTLAMQKNSTMA